MPVRHLGIPFDLARMAIQCEKMGIVGHNKEPVAGPSDATIDAGCPSARDPFGARPFEVPQHAAIAGIERIALIAAGYVHNAFDHQRRHLQKGSARKGEGPLRNEM